MLRRPVGGLSSLGDARSDQRTNIDREIQGPGADTLGWYEIARKLGHFLLSKVETPITIGIQGDWGSGKSSFINLVESSLGTKVALPNPPGPEAKLAEQLHHYVVDAHRGAGQQHAYVLRFDSWVFAQSAYSVDELFPIYVAQVIEDYLVRMGKRSNDHTIHERFAHVLRAAALTAVGSVAGETASEAVSVVLPGGQPTKLVSELASFKHDFQKVVNLLLDSSGDDYPNRLLIVVDDLDRIMPRAAVELTEKLKVFLDVRGVIFILAADLSIIQQGLRQKFGEGVVPAEGKNYLDKIVKIQYNVPQLQPPHLADLALGYGDFRQAFGLGDGTVVADLLQHDYFRLMTLFPTIGSNIRNSKRVLLNFEFSYHLTTSTTDPAPDAAFRLLAITVLYQYDHELARAFYLWLADPSKRNEHLVGLNPNAAPPINFFAGLDDMMKQGGKKEEGKKEGGKAVAAFFSLLLERRYTVGEWRAAYAAAAFGSVSMSSGDL